MHRLQEFRAAVKSHNIYRLSNEDLSVSLTTSGSKYLKGKSTKNQRLILLMMMKECIFPIGFLPEFRTHYMKIIEKRILKNAVLFTVCISARFNIRESGTLKESCWFGPNHKWVCRLQSANELTLSLL